MTSPDLPQLLLAVFCMIVLMLRAKRYDRSDGDTLLW